jgi:acetyltransferase
MTADTLAVATPNTVAGISSAMSGKSDNLRDRDTPALRSPHTDDDAHGRTMAEQMLQMVRAAGRTRLNPSEIEQLLTIYGISAVGVQYATGLDRRGEDSLGAGERSPGTTQQDATMDADYELVIGSHVDRQCGSVLSLRAGRPLPEVFQNRALALPPLTTTMARRMVERTGIAATLTGTDDRIGRGLGKLDQQLVRISQLIAEQRWIKELLLTLLVVPPEGLLIHDAQVSVYDAAVQAEELPTLAGHSYPAQYVAQWMLRDGSPVTIRPIRPEDEPLMVRFHETLSEQTVEMRYFGPQKLSQRIAPEQLLHLRCIDYDREMVLVVEQHDPTTGEQTILGLGCLITLNRSNDAEIALLVGDAWQGQGIGSELLRQLIQIGRDKGLARIIGEVLPDNHVALRILPRFRFQLHRSIGEPVRVVLDL